MCTVQMKEVAAALTFISAFQVCFSRRKWDISLSKCPDNKGVMGMETKNAGDQDTETFKAEIIPRTSGFHLRGLGSNLCVNKNQELSLTGYNENLQGGLLCLYSLTCGKPSSQELCISRLFQSPVITEKKKQQNCSIPDCFLSGQGKAIPMGYSSNGTEKETVTQRLSLPGHGRGTSGKGLSSATFEPWNISRFPLESF